MRNQKGVTLIALVVTIVVLLILAATSIAMLTGDDGIITNAQKAQAANTEGEVIDKMGLAYSSLRTEAMVQMSTTPGYQPSADANIQALAEMAAKELGLQASDVTSTPIVEPVTDGKYHVAYDKGAGTITMLYGDNKFALTAGSEAADNKYANIKGVITLTTTSVTYSAQPTRTVK